jgi:kynurenine formamidase
VKILLSYYIDNNSPYYIGTTKPEIEPNNQIDKGDDYNTYILKVENHCGTHVDAPRHFVSSGWGISDYDINDLIFKPLVVDLNKGPWELVTVDDLSKIVLDGFDCILFKTGFGKYREVDRNMYLTQNPGVSPETVHWLREHHRNIRCIGIDSISMSRYDDGDVAKKTHVTAFREDEKYGEPLLFIEDMKLDDVSNNTSIESMMVVPWQIKGIDSAPCTVIGTIDSSG